MRARTEILAAWNKELSQARWSARRLARHRHLWDFDCCRADCGFMNAITPTDLQRSPRASSETVLLRR